MGYGRRKRIFRRRRKKGYRARKSYSKKSINKNPSRAFFRHHSCQPDRLFVKLKYTENLVLTTAGGNTHYVYSGNSVFDPNVTGGGSQPMGYDEYSALYTRYNVHSCAIRVTAASTDAVPTYITLLPHADSSGFADLRTSIAHPNSRWKIIPASASTTRTIKHYSTTRKMLQIKDMSDHINSTAATTTNPTTRWYWILTFANTDAGNLALDMIVELTYYVEFSRPKELAMS